MAITVLDDVILPNSVILAGVRGRQIRRNTRVQNQSGVMQINVDWSRTLREYEIGIAPMPLTSWQAIEGLHEVTEGGAFGFLMEDPKDNAATLTDGVLTAISGSTYQLQKKYTSAGSTRTKNRKITRPRAGSLTITVSGTPLVEGVGFTVNYATGVVTIASAPAASSLAWSGRFYVPVHFQTDMIDWELVAAGQVDSRLLTGQSITLQEVAE